MERADARVAAPREDQLARAAHADELIVDQVGGHADEREIALALADDLVPRGEGDEMREPLERDGAPVGDVGGDRVVEGEELRHLAPSSKNTVSLAPWSTISIWYSTSRSRATCCTTCRAISVERRSGGTRWRIGSEAVRGSSSK